MLTRDLDPIAWAKLEIAALRALFAQDSIFAAPSDKQIMAINSLMGQGRSDHRREVRLQFFREISGLEELTSSAQLTSHTVSVLIDYLKEDGENWRLNEQGKRLLGIVEAWAVEKVGPKRERTLKKDELELDEDGWPVARAVQRKRRRTRKDKSEDPAIVGLDSEQQAVVSGALPPW